MQVNLPLAGREYVTWTVTGAPEGLQLEVSFNGGAWRPLTRAGDEFSLLLAGLDAQGDSDAVVLPPGRYAARIRAVDNPEVVIRNAGSVYVS